MEDQRIHRKPEMAAQTFRRPADGITTGFPHFDNKFGGFRNGELTLLAARPAEGKTTVMANALYNIAAVESIPALLFSLELRGVQMTRLLMKICCEECAPASESSNNERISFLKRAPLYIDDTPSIPLNQIKEKATRFVEEFGAAIIAIDYLQLISSGLEGCPGREAETTYIVSELKALAEELNIPIVVCAQILEPLTSAAVCKCEYTLQELRKYEPFVDAADKVLLLRDNPLLGKDGSLLITGRKTLYPIKGYSGAISPITFSLDSQSRRITG